MNKQHARERVESWISSRGWQLKAFQRSCIKAYLGGEHAIVSAPTGSGKTLAAVLGFFMESLTQADVKQSSGLQLLYISPLRALNNDIEKIMTQLAEDLLPHWRVATRSGDTSSYDKQKQKKKPPQILLTTPESLAILLTQKNSEEFFSSLRLVVCDEWHDLIGNKRGCLLQLNLAHLRRINPRFRSWALSATLADVELAARVLHSGPVKILKARNKRRVMVDVLLPRKGRLPPTGHYGTQQIATVADKVNWQHSNLLFVNTRAQAETWYKMLLQQFPQHTQQMAIHHGSVAAELRQQAEDDMKAGRCKLLVCTASLDLGVDFPAVDHVYQIGSPKSVNRLIQRAGRCRHRPNESARISLVPTFESQLLEIQALRQLLQAQHREEINVPLLCIDVLVQHVVSRALNEDSTVDQLFHEVTQTYAFAQLSRADFDWIIDFLSTGGACLKAYEGHHRIKVEDKLLIHANKKASRIHLMNMGTITEDVALSLKLRNGKRLGSVEDRFIASLTPGDRFVFGGELLEFVKIHDAHAIVAKAKSGKALSPKWLGGRLSLSEDVSDKLSKIPQGENDFIGGVKEKKALRNLLHRQQVLSHCPAETELLVENFSSREGRHLFVFPFAGKKIHHALALLFAYRLFGQEKTSVSLSTTELGFELLYKGNEALPKSLVSQALSPNHLMQDLEASANLTELARQHFRETAGISIVCPKRQPGNRKSGQQLRVSASLLFNVFQRFEPDNLLIRQARREAFDREFSEARLPKVLKHLQQKTMVMQECKSISPLALPVLCERLMTVMSTESLTERILRMTKNWQDI